MSDFKAAGMRVGERLWGRERLKALEGSGSENTTDAYWELGLFAWSLYERPRLDVRTRLLLTLAVDVAGGFPDALKVHTHACLNNGVSPQDIKEAITQIAPYVGLPATNQAFAVVSRCFAQHVSLSSQRDEHASE
jgi:alkylhydroperoxidase/carboxymuconolactone decarboxylase family protein YurZ